MKGKNINLNSPVSGISKRITNHYPRKTMVKTLKQNKTPKSKIISITEHNTEARLDAYGSCESHEPKPKCTKFPSSHTVFPNNPCIQNPCFSFFPNQNPVQLASPFSQASFNFHNWSVSFVENTSVLQQQNYQSSSITQRKWVRIIESSDSLQK